MTAPNKFREQVTAVVARELSDLYKKDTLSLEEVRKLDILVRVWRGLGLEEGKDHGMSVDEALAVVSQMGNVSTQ